MNTAKTAKEAPDVPVAINTHVRQTEAVNFPLFPHIPGGPGDAEKIDNVSGLDGAVMNAIDALKVAHAADIKIALDGDDLALTAASEPPTPVLDALTRHKREIVALLRPDPDGWTADWQVYFDERSGIAEFDGGLTRADAETQAFQCCVVEWLNRNPVSSPPGRCLGCGGRENTTDRLLPYGTEQTGHAWLHSRCWEAWHANRKAKAVAILSLTLGAG
jgi:hypothetical protein